MFLQKQGDYILLFDEEGYLLADMTLLEAKSVGKKLIELTRPKNIKTDPDQLTFGDILVG